MTAIEAVFSGDDLRATLFDPDCDDLIVTFDHREEDKTSFGSATPSKAFAESGWANLRISTRANDWFCNAETEALCAALTVLGDRFSRRRLIGYSMGGYGALRFAGALSAQAVMLVSPQAAVHPDLAGFDPRYAREGGVLDPGLHDLAPFADAALKGLLIVDPFTRRDLTHARAIQGLFPGLSLARLAFAGHPATRTITAAGKGWSVRRAAISPHLDPGGIHAAHRKGRHRCPTYWRRMARLAGSRHAALAAHAGERAAALTPPP